MRLFLILVLFSLGQISFAQGKGIVGTIRISVSGAVDKPYPSIILNLNGKVDTLPDLIDTGYGKVFRIPQGVVLSNGYKTDTITSPFIHIININEKVFHEIDSFIAENPTSNTNDPLRNPIAIAISLNGKKKNFLFDYKTFISSLFKKIEDELNGGDKQEVNEVFTSLLRRLSWPSSLISSIIKRK